MSTFNNKSLCDEALVKYHDVTHCRAIRCLVSLRHFLKEMYWFLKTCLSSSLLLGMHVGETLSLLIKHISIWYLLLLKKRFVVAANFHTAAMGGISHKTPLYWWNMSVRLSVCHSVFNLWIREAFFTWYS